MSSPSRRSWAWALALALALSLLYSIPDLRVPALSRMLDSCGVLYERNPVVLKAACVAVGGRS